MKRKRIFFGLAALAMAGGAWWAFARKAGNRVQLTTVHPAYGNLVKSVTATGTVQPVDTVAVGTQVSGTIKTIYADFNSVVKKGQLLAELDPVLLASQKEQVAANLQSAKANLSYATEAFSRQKQLYAVGAISRSDFETATYQYNAAADNVQSIGSQLRAADKNLSFTRIYSPINGTVLSRNVSAGQTVAASLNTPTLFSIAADLTQMQVRASVDEADIGNVKPGENITFTVDAFPLQTFAGTVQEVRLEPSVSANVVTYTTIISTHNADGRLKPGMTANINIITREEDGKLLLPLPAIQFHPAQTLVKQFIIRPYQKSAMRNKVQGLASVPSGSSSDTALRPETVWIAHGDTLLQKPVWLELSDDVQAVVVKGLTAGDAVVTGTEDPRSASRNTGADRSPFMPARGGNTKSR